MHVLLIKTSSMGDVIHALPALTDAMHAIPNIRFDWVVEEAFQEIPAWHPAVDRVIPVALRRWRRHPLQALGSGEWKMFVRVLRERKYDLVLDSQGLLKSAWLARKARGVCAGFDWGSIREPIASWFYQRNYSVPKEGHAIARQRELFAGALSYEMPKEAPRGGLQFSWLPREDRKQIIFFPGTSWPSKEWPEADWKRLLQLTTGAGYQVVIAWGSNAEREKAKRLATAGGAVLPKMSISDLAKEISLARGVIGVDSGLAHLAAVIGVPGVTLYGATDPQKTGAIGERQKNLQGEAGCSPCLMRVCRHVNESGQQICWQPISPDIVFKAMQQVMQ
jgi:heptosyltransferase-1